LPATENVEKSGSSPQIPSRAFRDDRSRPTPRRFTSLLLHSPQFELKQVSIQRPQAPQSYFTSRRMASSTKTSCTKSSALALSCLFRHKARLINNPYYRRYKSSCAFTHTFSGGSSCKFCTVFRFPTFDGSVSNDVQIKPFAINCDGPPAFATPTCRAKKTARRYACLYWGGKLQRGKKNLSLDLSTNR
jgi:hypothetical protein